MLPIPEDDLYARTSPDLLAVHATERAAIEFEAAMRGETERWFFAITDIHQALTAALVATVSGTNRIGALVGSQQEEWLNFYEASREDPNAQAPKERDRIAPLTTLLSRAQSCNDGTGTLALTDGEASDLKRLNDFRNDLAHVKPVGWSLEIAGLPRILRAAANTLGQLFQMSPLLIHLEEDQLNRAKAALNRFTAT